ncbi:hypothetical protein [Cyanobium sp. WAJ14-Wanaka]|uniref:hypothetical protein n=1 Tax=Cyanobium sp. WAJ14-Wanaka TaxID=2823725 RepID=UPI0020CC55A5|nr:hypothetical protein [Cyanobium sp. WAJ14-Wanaka]
MQLKSPAMGWAFLAALSLGATNPALAQSQLLEKVKQNPAEARQICAELRQLNSSGISSTSPQAIKVIAKQNNLSPMDAEVLSTYVIGLHCPDVR